MVCHLGAAELNQQYVSHIAVPMGSPDGKKKIKLHFHTEIMIFLQISFKHTFVSPFYC